MSFDSLTEHVATPPILEVRGLRKKFGSFNALDGVDLKMSASEVVGLVGPNGSGKTTCINVISGLLHADGGTIRYLGQDVGHSPIRKRVALGINRNFQIPKPFKSLTVQENLAIALRYGGGRRRLEEVEALMASLGLESVAWKRASELTSAQQKMLDLGRALATRPRLLCVDELGAGLSRAELAQVAERLRALADSGIALLVVEHLMDFVDRVTDRVVVLSAGRNIFGGRLSDAVHDREVMRVFLGDAGGD